jgi:hypothetical protein
MLQQYIKGLRKVDVYIPHQCDHAGDLVETSQSLMHSSKLIAVE